jgi:dynein heavy chain
VINFLGARVNYGGRVTDKKDIVLITTILRNFINPNVLSDDYTFSESGYYRSIPATNQ